MNEMVSMDGYSRGNVQWKLALVSGTWTKALKVESWGDTGVPVHSSSIQNCWELDAHQGMSKIHAVEDHLLLKKKEGNLYTCYSTEEPGRRFYWVKEAIHKGINVHDSSSHEVPV